ncbi:MAG: hypothetical protein XD76_0535 [candidate division TA06 bacterium 32_111]|uniref:Uncharacterized protein n=2 Tax=Bacteria candidate phyla TaxID=1783234 RepID=A0A117M6R4_UNCT6|nr:MAG: hypothetical protein XD76_0535 [candidate division TA06 bacterium 32_111]KUK87427.1 MAG: hypothetical protein XE03_0825 [candidate division TA06 bacterium 34_109]HAF07740.1 hypothetical protein [candidate division WOR-3 bacterium]HCP17258.1 hypothetical protein [candidate division WOR-3 bacterium]
MELYNLIINLLSTIIGGSLVFFSNKYFNEQENKKKVIESYRNKYINEGILPILIYLHIKQKYILEQKVRLLSKSEPLNNEYTKELRNYKIPYSSIVLINYLLDQSDDLIGFALSYFDGDEIDRHDLEQLAEIASNMIRIFYKLSNIINKLTYEQIISNDKSDFSEISSKLNELRNLELEGKIK